MCRLFITLLNGSPIYTTSGVGIGKKAALTLLSLVTLYKGKPGETLAHLRLHHQVIVKP